MNTSKNSIFRENQKPSKAELKNATYCLQVVPAFWKTDKEEVCVLSMEIQSKQKRKQQTNIDGIDIDFQVVEERIRTWKRIDTG
ncbi:hypothetical protein TNIN_230611 [Trichonephila inaurata madagascariensis]|uniref:Uncharacterized protein n=1 Tax=Trichonephila inaurata madagascariensis TaxID=2747483 RepID=A0A8X6XX69_9ARAC|nr:hypothetical protein TNIN_230611 [Trichonephila inaurata madagascariensis]